MHSTFAVHNLVNILAIIVLGLKMLYRFDCHEFDDAIAVSYIFHIIDSSLVVGKVSCIVLDDIYENMIRLALNFQMAKYIP